MKEKKKRTPLQNFLIIIGVIVGWVVLLVAPLFLSFVFPPTYKEDIAITKGEFPFKIEYEIDGERKTIEDTWIYKYVNTVEDFVNGTTRDWDISLKSDREEIVLYEKDNIQLICFPIGSPWYYMGELERVKEYIPNFPRVNSITYKGEINKVEKEIDYNLSADKLYENYKFKWISGEYPDPIVNDFGEDK